MSIELQNTGERMIEGAYVQTRGAYVIYAMHMASYRFSMPFCAGRKVLDLGCGSGYGVSLVAGQAKHVTGVDISPDAIRFARERYRGENVEFLQILPDEALPFADDDFDVVLSFQVIEHVDNDAAYLAEACRVLKPGGTLVLITPDRANRLFPGQKPWNRWHVREYSSEQLVRRVEKRFEVAQALRMGGPWNVIGVEARRCTRTKWLTLPFTLPFLPDWVRQKGLNFLHLLQKTPQTIRANQEQAAPDFGFDERNIDISDDPPNSMNLVVVARKSGENA